MRHIRYIMIQEKISSEMIEIERHEQEVKQEIQRQLAMNPKGGSDTKVVDEAKLQEFIGKVVNEWGASSRCINHLCWRQAWIVQSDGRSR